MFFFYLFQWWNQNIARVRLGLIWGNFFLLSAQMHFWVMWSILERKKVAKGKSLILKFKMKFKFFSEIKVKYLTSSLTSDSLHYCTLLVLNSILNCIPWRQQSEDELSVLDISCWAKVDPSMGETLVGIASSLSLAQRGKGAGAATVEPECYWSA